MKAFQKSYAFSCSFFRIDSEVSPNHIFEESMASFFCTMSRANRHLSIFVTGWKLYGYVNK